MATRNQQTRVFDAAATCALFDGDAAAVRELVALVVGDLPVYVRKLQASLASGDHASAARDAHRLKGTVLNVHAAPLAALCEANRGKCKLYFDVTTTALPRPVRLHARTAVVDPTPDLMKGLNRLFGRDAILLEAEA